MRIGIIYCGAYGNTAAYNRQELLIRGFRSSDDLDCWIITTKKNNLKDWKKSAFRRLLVLCTEYVIILADLFTIVNLKPNSLIIFDSRLHVFSSCVIVAKLFGIPVFYERTERLDLEFQTLPSPVGTVLGHLFRVVLSCCDLVAAINQNLRLSLQAHCSRVIPLESVVDFEFWNDLKSSEPLFENEISIFYCGSDIFKKDDLETVLRAVDLLIRRGLKLRLLLAGHHSKQESKTLKQIVSDLEINESVSVLGFVSSTELVRLSHLAHVLIVPKADNLQNRFNFPIKLGEYLSVGRPVVCAEIESITQQISDSDVCYLYKPGDPSDLARIIEIIALNFEEALEVATAGTRFAQERFDFRSVSEKLHVNLIRLNQQ